MSSDDGVVVDPPAPDRAGDSVESTAALVGSPPAALPEELGGEAAMVGHREAEDTTLPEQAVPIPDHVVSGHRNHHTHSDPVEPTVPDKDLGHGDGEREITAPGDTPDSPDTEPVTARKTTAKKATKPRR